MSHNNTAESFALRNSDQPTSTHDTLSSPPTNPISEQRFRSELPTLRASTKRSQTLVRRHIPSIREHQSHLSRDLPTTRASSSSSSLSPTPSPLTLPDRSFINASTSHPHAFSSSRDDDYNRDCTGNVLLTEKSLFKGLKLPPLSRFKVGQFVCVRRFYVNLRTWSDWREGIITEFAGPMEYYVVFEDMIAAPLLYKEALAEICAFEDAEPRMSVDECMTRFIETEHVLVQTPPESAGKVDGVPLSQYWVRAKIVTWDGKDMFVVELLDAPFTGQKFRIDSSRMLLYSPEMVHKCIKGGERLLLQSGGGLRCFYINTKVAGV